MSEVEELIKAINYLNSIPIKEYKLPEGWVIAMSNESKIGDKNMSYDIPTDDLDKDVPECSHDDMEDGICLVCGEDLTEELSARAYDMYKDRMKYGED